MREESILISLIWRLVLIRGINNNNYCSFVILFVHLKVILLLKQI